MKKKLALTAAAAALVGTLAVGGTLAWFTDTETATNVVTTGNVDITLSENGGEDGDIITGSGLRYENITPGKEYTKVVTVDNVGKNDAYVRATVKITSDNELVLQGLLGNINPAFSLTNLAEGGEWSAEVMTADNGSKYIEYVVYYADEEGNVFEPKDTWKLFDAVAMPGEMGNEYENSELTIQVTVDAIQVENVNGTTMDEIFGAANGIGQETDFDLNKKVDNDKVGTIATSSEASR